MSYKVQSQIIDTLDTVDNLLNCLNEEQTKETRNILLRGVIKFYRDNNMESFSLTMMDFFNQTVVDTMNRLKDELEDE